VLLHLLGKQKILMGAIAYLDIPKEKYPVLNKVIHYLSG
jgi:hypothetical protein